MHTGGKILWRTFCLAIATAAALSGAVNAYAANRPPDVKPIHANLVLPTTHYSVEATDPDGDPLTYDWQGDISCGQFRPTTESIASWDHPDGNPPWCSHRDGTSHRGTITVRVSDGTNTVVCTYSGSESGDGPACSVNKPAPSGDDTSGEDEEGWVFIIMGAIGLGWWLTTNGLFVTDPNDPCAKEKAVEIEARAKMESAERAFEELDRAKSAADAAERRAHGAEGAAQRAVSAAGGRWSAHGSTDWQGEHIEVDKEGWQDKELGQKADDAAAAAKDARADAVRTKNNFERHGGSSAWDQAKDELAKAIAAWEAARDALKKCLLQPVTAPEPPTTPASPMGGMTTDGGTPGVAATPPHTPPRTPPTEEKKPRLVCVDGERRNEKSETLTVELLDLQSARLMQDRIYSDAGNEAMKFVDWLQTIKDVFLMGKAMKGGAEGYLEGSLDGAADAAGLPDFLTWYDKAVDELTKSMHKLALIMRDKQQLGYYWLEYTAKRVTLTCASYEICENNRWVKHCELSITENGSRTGRTDPEEVFDVKELQPAIRKLFTKLRGRFNGDKERAKKFSEACNKCS